MAKKPRQHPIRKLLFIIVLAIIGVCGIYYYFNQSEVDDRITTLFYKPSPEISVIEQKLNLTDRGSLVFRASDPVLESKDDFNAHCGSHNQEISVLGCYTAGRIYLYRIDSEVLDGAIESTAAHELLHAVWERLSSKEKDNITPLLNQVYSENQELLEADLKTYDEAERLEEIYVRAATEITKLPDELEKHYAKYFKTQDQVVTFYDTYIEPFNKLTKELNNLEAEMESIKQNISNLETAYKSIAEDLNFEITSFNNCANTAGCFINETLFRNARNALLSKQSNVDAKYEELNSLIEKYNEKVNLYNQNILRGQTLEQAINSNAENDKIIKKE